MNFGKWIVVAFVLFAVFIATLVAVCVRQDVSLVTKEYYQEELRYQEQIERRNNTEALAEVPRISVRGNKVVVIDYAMLPDIEKGELRLFRPSDSRLDQSFDVARSSTTSQKFEISNARPGLYKARLTWLQDGKEYYLEKIVVL